MQVVVRTGFAARRECACAKMAGLVPFAAGRRVLLVALRHVVLALTVHVCAAMDGKACHVMWSAMEMDAAMVALAMVNVWMGDIGASASVVGWVCHVNLTRVQHV